MSEFLNGVLVSILTTRGDMLYRNASGGARLAKGAENDVLVQGADDPAWSATLAGLTLTSPTINGTIATAGLIMPAFQCSANVDVNGYTWSNIATLTGKTTGSLVFLSVRTNSDNAIFIQTPGVSPGFSPITRLTFSGRSNTGTFTWAAGNHVFGNGMAIQTTAADNNFLSIKAWDVDGSVYQVMFQVKAADDPELAFYGVTPVARQTGVGVNIAEVHAALVNLGLINT